MSVCRDNLLNCALRNGGREFDSLTFRQYLIVMEIRRCDKCNKSLDPELIDNFSYGYFAGDVKAIHITIPVLKESMIVPPPEPGLDDRDEFGGSLCGRKIDLCDDCYPLLARMMTDWLK